MILLSGMLQREALRGVLDRWLMGSFEPSDCGTLKQVVNFNAYLGRLLLFDFANGLLGDLVGQPVRSFAASRKGTLKDFVVANSPVHSPRIDAMAAHYRRFPEDHYRETPFEGRIFAIDGPSVPLYVMSTRSKRMRRIAEKGARRIVDYIFDEIIRRADELATERAAQLGVPKERLLTPVEKQIEEFAHAERRMIKSIRTGTFFEHRPRLAIHDYLGAKVITDFMPLDRLRDWFSANPAIEVIEEEEHKGRYNAVNFLLRLRLDKDRLLARPPNPEVCAILETRGAGVRSAVPAAYETFVATAEDEVVLEVIASSYDEMLESEIGRTMHESRVLDQRRLQRYRGHLAKNVEYLVEYALAFAVCPLRRIDDLPLRVWVKYMPDTFDDMMKRLWGISPAASIPCSEAGDGDHEETLPA